jgi:hypothetical protein
MVLLIAMYRLNCSSQIACADLTVCSSCIQLNVPVSRALTSGPHLDSACLATSSSKTGTAFPFAPDRYMIKVPVPRSPLLFACVQVHVLTTLGYHYRHCNRSAQPARCVLAAVSRRRQPTVVLL